MAKITISQLHNVDADSIQELTDAEIDATKGGLTLVAAPLINLKNTAILGQADTYKSSNTVGKNILQSLLGVVLL
ncbi:hypothetical protein WA1_44115 [Scytonema hofmannii PCC 7110]|uniref:Uncharacterized protein n=1 Tax=Scytonema hofmannii PCC 7110 TaxID=128403 RepID=A0A139WWB3_9CYAN|nr:hypothetical protein [Scytonema hofmannii]KYC36672.1 hypothetical protein WA1_44115 [Scytonema hofmannii PCC 7110]